MKTQQWISIAAAALLAAAVTYWFTTHHVRSGQGTSSTVEERKVLYWYDPMVPNQHFAKPGKSPFMDMQLTPKYADEDGDANVLRIDPGIVQNLGMRTTTVEQGSLSRSIDAVGALMFNQRDMAVVQARAGGFVSRVYARAPGDVLKRGEPLVDLLVPDWAAGQREFLALLAAGDAALIDAARERLGLLGMPAESIERLEATRKPETTFTVRTPIAGAIQSLDVREGMNVSAGAPLATLNGLQTVWLEAAVPEVSGAVSTGKYVQASLTAFPGETFKGKVIDILPEANPETRTLRVRIELDNRSAKLRPGMFAQVRLESGGAPVLYVASEAVIRTGTRNIVLIAGEQGRFMPTEVEIGGEVDGKTVILRGLTAGQKVVASGQFLIDSEASLKGLLNRLDSSAPPKETAMPSMHQASGKVESVSAETLVVSHGPVPSLNWPAMTMGFKLGHAELAKDLKAGDAVTIQFRQAGDDFIVERVEKNGGAP